MTPQELLAHLDSGQLWPSPRPDSPGYDMASAYADALAVRALRIQRGEVPRGYKIGFTNRTIWPRYNVFAPIWGTVWDRTLSFSSGEHQLSLKGLCQPRIEPEIVFGFREAPKPSGSMEDIYQALDWIAPGFEIVQSHLPDWRFNAIDTVVDSGLHGCLVVGDKLRVPVVSTSANGLHDSLAQATATLFKEGLQIDQGVGANVLDSPLRALVHFLKELRLCPGATDIQPGDVVTTGTWTDAWPVQAGETWSADFNCPMSSITLHFTH